MHVLTAIGDSRSSFLPPPDTAVTDECKVTYQQQSSSVINPVPMAPSPARLLQSQKFSTSSIENSTFIDDDDAGLSSPVMTAAESGSGGPNITPFSYTTLTLPTNRTVYVLVGDEFSKTKKEITSQ